MLLKLTTLIARALRVAVNNGLAELAGRKPLQRRTKSFIGSCTSLLLLILYLIVVIYYDDGSGRSCL